MYVFVFEILTQSLEFNKQKVFLKNYYSSFENKNGFWPSLKIWFLSIAINFKIIQ